MTRLRFTTLPDGTPFAVFCDGRLGSTWRRIYDAQLRARFDAALMEYLMFSRPLVFCVDGVDKIA